MSDAQREFLERALAAQKAIGEITRGYAETYLGDGLYASWDGFMVTLRAPREDGDHWVALEPAVWRALQDYMRKAGK